MKHFKRYFFLLYSILIGFVAIGQQPIFPAKSYPQGYFTWPVIAKQGLVANFGELRNNHYHMGLDCRTDQHENVQVVAAADGYIAKVKIEPFGFGRCIYLNHSNGLTTLYAHLNNFYPELEEYIKQQQYKLESWHVFLELPANLFKVKKGDFIAYSGNTGGSQGPHLHFEIRDTETEKVLNPLLFGFNITDNVAPDIYRLAWYDRTKSTYEQTARFVPVKKANGIYQTTPTLLTVNTNKISFGITAVDRLTGSSNANGIYEATIFDGGKAIVGFQIDSISYDETRYMNAHTDFALHTKGGAWVQHLSRLPGYTNGIYKEFSGDGVIDLSDHEVHNILIYVKDTEGNTSELKFAVQSNAKETITAATLPNLFKPGYINVFENADIRCYLPEQHIYDSVHFNVKAINPIHGGKAFLLLDGYVPIHTFYPIRIRYPNAPNPDRMVMHRWWGGKNDFAKAEKEQDWYKASFKALGNVELFCDQTPPTISAIGFKEGMNAAKLGRLVFVIRDLTDELRNFRAELDGKWLRFSNDKGKTFIYQFDEHCGPGEHTLKIYVEDVAGNATEKIYHFKR